MITILLQSGFKICYVLCLTFQLIREHQHRVYSQFQLLELLIFIKLVHIFDDLEEVSHYSSVNTFCFQYSVLFILFIFYLIIISLVTYELCLIVGLKIF